MIRLLLAGLAAIVLMPAHSAPSRSDQATLLEPGVSLALAKWRSRHYRDIRYRLEAALAPALDALQGTIEIEVTLARRVDLVLDWRVARGARVSAVTVDGAPAIDVRAVNEHLVIPAERVRAGPNAIRMNFESPIAVAGTAVQRYRDREDGSDYVYSLLVPSDASTVFPCFDQPDLKARFAFSLEVPDTWTVIGNAPIDAERPVPSARARKRVQFRPTEPISTYLFAFAAGPFVDVSAGASAQPGSDRLFVRRSRVDRARHEAAAVLDLNRRALAYFSAYFARPFPFAKSDLVLIPEFAFNGMEHAGATFLREEAVLFPSVPTEEDKLQRAKLIFHETSHQWFGDLVTMRWFDDLWLKEGFANLMAAKATAALISESDAWIGFLALKTSAYRTDVTRGTTPIWQSLGNLSAAKSAYGNIVYSKGPALLRQIEFDLGADVFQAAVRRFLERHAYSSASWRDLVRTLEETSGCDLSRWARAWITGAGAPKIRVDWRGDRHGKLSALSVHQLDALGERRNRPQRFKLWLGGDAAHDESLDVRIAASVTRVDRLDGRAVPRYVLPNDGDFGYGIFLLDDVSRKALVDDLRTIADPLRRALVWNALWETVRDAQLPPRDFIAVGIGQLAGETNELTISALLARLQVAYRWYLPVTQQREIGPPLEHALLHGLEHAPTSGLRIAYFRALIGIATTAEGLARLKAIARGQAQIAGVAVSARDRFRIAQRLLTVSDPAAVEFLLDLAAQEQGDDARRYAYAAGAAQRERKSEYFDAFHTKADLAESWIEESVGPLNAPEQAEVTLPLLAAALDVLPALKHERKIFFVNRWLAAFIGGQTTSAALDTVNDFLERTPNLDADLQRKVLEALDDLERTVRIRSVQSAG